MVFNKKQKGETLIEVITALTALVLAGMASVTVIISVMHSNAISKEYLIAQNLAREGIEGVISIRNTNWLKYPSDKENCWLALDPNNCAIKVVDGGTYILEMGADSEGFKLTKKETALDLANGGEDTSTNTEFKMKVVKEGSFSIGGLYKQGNVTEMTNPPRPNFYRMIKFTELDPKVSFKVTVTMQWFTKSQINTYELTSIITNYAK